MSLVSLWKHGCGLKVVNNPQNTNLAFIWNLWMVYWHLKYYYNCVNNLHATIVACEIYWN
jgi:hypothetical protein